jgi:hypothetical protein
LKLNNKERREIVDRLMELPEIASQGRRDDIVENLPLKVKSAISTYTDARSHINAIVRTSDDYNALEELYNALKSYYPELQINREIEK